MADAMIVSLGGTPEPVARAIAEHKPQFVCYLASQQSVYVLGKVQDMLKDQDVDIRDTKTVLVDDANDLVHCFEKALECGRFLDGKDVPRDRVVVDYTGGTKNMTAALAFATARKGYLFSYVGGTTRTKEGLGIVESGSEIVYTRVSPWQIFAVEEWYRLALLLEHYQYEAALDLIAETLTMQPKRERLRWEGLRSVVHGLHKWDNFIHKDALKELQTGMKALEEWAQISKDTRLETFISQGKTSLAFLQGMAAATKGFKSPSRHMVIDLLSNSERRAAQGRYDDATARLYRALEMHGQVAFMERTGAGTSDVPEDCLPEELRQEYVDRYRDARTGKIQIPLLAVFRVLKALDDPAAKTFFEIQEEFNKILSARNHSILAHGVQPVSGSTFTQFLGLIRNTFSLTETVVFPVLESPY